MGTAALPHSTIGEYRLIDLLGAGGMGEVYRAVHSRFGRVVAIKVLAARGCRPNLIQRFRNEASIQAQLQHPNIARLYGFLETDDRPCIVMEYVDGPTLEEAILARGPLPLAEALPIFQAIVAAIGYIHNHGIIHRDIKASNIKLTTNGQVKLLDFGIAKTESTLKLTATGETIGTLEYLSPEQFKGGLASVQSDLWALGVLFYEMVTGRVPFEAKTFSDLCDQVRKANYPPPSTICPSVPREAEAVIARCLKRHPRDRYQSAQELSEALEQLTVAGQEMRRSALRGLPGSRLTV